MVKKYFGELGLSFAHLEDLTFLFPSYCGHPCPILVPASPHGVIRVMGLADCCSHHSAHLGRAALTVGAMPSVPLPPLALADHPFVLFPCT